MNTGAVSPRYAKALLKYVQESGRGDSVCQQAELLLRNPDSVREMTLEPDLVRFLEFVIRKGRMSEIRLILHSFVDMYYRSIGVLKGHLKTSVPAPGLAERLTPLLEKQFGGKVQLESETDPSIIGGFIIEIGEYQLDASVRHQIEAIRKEFVISTNRLV